MQKRKVAIIGANGNIGQVIRKGSVDFSNNFDIVGITREYFDCDPRELTYEKPSLGDCEKIILAVKPDDAINALSLLSGKMSSGTLIISTVSGLDINTMALMLKVPYDRLVTMTLNTAVSTGNGIAVYSSVSESTNNEVREFMSPMCKAVAKRKAKEIPHSVVMYGSGHAYNMKHILNLWSENFSHVSLEGFIAELSPTDDAISSYIETIERVCQSMWGDHDFIWDSVDSSIKHLKAVGCKSKDDIIKQIDMVATKNGCTREGVDEYDSTAKNYYNFFLENFGRSYKKVKAFNRSIVDKYYKSKNINKGARFPY